MENNILYINLCNYDSCIYENFAKNIEKIQNSNGVIFDVRGYPTFEALSIISHFIKENVELGNLLKPVYYFPNQENVKYNLAEKWQIVPADSPQSKDMSKKNEYKEPLPIHIEKRVVFLANESAMSFAETFLDMMKQYKVGTIIGTATAGCNGDVTRFEMTGASFFMTYNKFLNRDGSRHNSIGVLPDINCEMKISDIQNNIDTQLKKAEEFIAKQ